MRPVESTVELQKLGPLRRAARDPNAGERCLAAAGHEPEPLDPGVELDNALGELDERRAERRVVARVGLGDMRMRVATRAEPHAIV